MQFKSLSSTDLTFSGCFQIDETLIRILPLSACSHLQDRSEREKKKEKFVSTGSRWKKKRESEPSPFSGRASLTEIELMHAKSIIG